MSHFLSLYSSCNLTHTTIAGLFLVVLYASSAIYFAGVMVRLMLTLTPVVCVFAAIAFSHTFENYLHDDPSSDKPANSSNQSAPSTSASSPVKEGKVRCIRISLVANYVKLL